MCFDGQSVGSGLIARAAAIAGLPLSDPHERMHRVMKLAYPWQLVTASDGECRRWASGTVSSVEDLYAQSVFGPAQDLRCECGALTGASNSGRICANCRVWVLADSATARRTRLGLVELAFPCAHPLSGDAIVSFPVAPIQYRITDSGSPTDIGLRYEKLLSTNLAEVSRVGAAGSSEYFQSLPSRSANRIVAILTEIVLGDTPVGSSSKGACLLSLLIDSIRSFRPEAYALVRSCGLAVETSARI
jgi:hypothetical protein